ncbi:MAG: DNA internalization-related competence protein ComEC/Rec2 [Firmicutes bacterium]|nr:DNA internalization-related competence protein ComEC/Rec2 [Bacillota bacterium]
MRRPLLVLITLFILGIAVAKCLSLSLATMEVALFLSGVLAGVGYYRRWPQTTAIIMFICFGTGIFWGGLAWENKKSSLLSNLETYVTLTGWVAEEPQRYPDRLVYRLAVEQIITPDGVQPVNELVLLKLYTKRHTVVTYRYGDILRVHGQLQLPKAASNPGEFDYQAYLARQGIFTQVSATEPEQVVRVGSGRGNPLTHLALSIKVRVVEQLERELPGNQAAILQGIIFGDQEQLPAEEVKAYQATGLFHVFSVSGLHVGFVLLFGLSLANLFRFSYGISSLLTAGLLIIYGFLTGWPACVARAILMGLLALGAKGLNRDNDLLNSLAVAAWLILLWDPLALYDLGFQLSFAATWGLVYLYPALDYRLAHWPRWRTLFLVPLAAQLATLPLVAYYFNQVSLISLVANVVVVGLIGAVVLLGLGIIPLTFVWPAVAGYLTSATGGLIWITNLIIHGLARLPGSTLTVATPHLVLVFAYYGLLMAIVSEHFQPVVGLFKTLSPRQRTGVIVGTIAVTLVVALVWANWPRPLRMVFLDVGQGDCIFIETPGGKQLLVDGGGRPAAAGGTFDVGERVVLPFLRRQGINHLDAVINTHAHDDHLQGLIPIIDEIRVTVVAVAAYPSLPKNLSDYLTAAQQRGSTVITLARDQVWDVEPGVTLEVLHPGRWLTGTRSDLNNNSLVLRLRYGQTEIMLPGDIEREAMTELLQAQVSLAADVYKLSHHGSQYALEPRFLQAVNPQAVVIQVGKNSFGHPAPEVIQYWERQGVPIYRTDRDGAVTLTSDGRTIRVRTFK